MSLNICLSVLTFGLSFFYYFFTKFLAPLELQAELQSSLAELNSDLPWQFFESIDLLPLISCSENSECLFDSGYNENDYSASLYYFLN
jgi:hypothetical protein